MTGSVSEVFRCEPLEPGGDRLSTPSSPAEDEERPPSGHRMNTPPAALLLSLLVRAGERHSCQLTSASRLTCQVRICVDRVPIVFQLSPRSFQLRSVSAWTPSTSATFCAGARGPARRRGRATSSGKVWCHLPSRWHRSLPAQERTFYTLLSK